MKLMKMKKCYDYRICAIGLFFVETDGSRNFRPDAQYESEQLQLEQPSESSFPFPQHQRSSEAERERAQVALAILVQRSRLKARHRSIRQIIRLLRSTVMIDKFLSANRKKLKAPSDRATDLAESTNTAASDEGNYHVGYCGVKTRRNASGSKVFKIIWFRWATLTTSDRRILVKTEKKQTKKNRTESLKCC